MKYLNLTKGYDPFNKVHTIANIDFESFFFSGGEPHIKLDDFLFSPDEDIMITTRLTSMNDLGMLMVAKDVIDNFGAKWNGRCILFTPYFLSKLKLYLSK